LRSPPNGGKGSSPRLFDSTPSPRSGVCSQARAEEFLYGFLSIERPPFFIWITTAHSRGSFFCLQVFFFEKGLRSLFFDEVIFFPLEWLKSAIPPMLAARDRAPSLTGALLLSLSFSVVTILFPIFCWYSIPFFNLFLGAILSCEHARGFCVHGSSPPPKSSFSFSPLAVECPLQWQDPPSQTKCLTIW